MVNLDALVAPLRADVVSGASVVGRTAADVVRRAAVRLPAEDASDLRGQLGALSLKILDAQPAMAPLVSLARDVLEALDGVEEGAGSLDEARRAAAHAAERFREEVEARARRVARRASKLLPEGCTVLTLSSSTTVRAAILHAAERGVRVICLEGRPMTEGQGLATALARARVPVLFAVDAAAWCMAQGADRVLVGADSVGDRGVVNKIGSAAVVAAAREAGIPVYLTADRTKLLPPGFPQPVDDDRPAEEVWRAPHGVRVWNRYFEAVPLDRMDGVVTEDDLLTPAAAEALRRGLTAPAELRRWAEARGEGGAAGGNGESGRG